MTIFENKFSLALYLLLTALGLGLIAASAQASESPLQPAEAQASELPQGGLAYAYVGDIPAGYSVTIIYDALINPNISPNVTQLNSQGTVSGTNVVSIATDDPATASLFRDPTITRMGNNISLSKSGLLAAGALGLPGEQVTWQMVAANITDASLSNVTITDVIRPEMQVAGIVTSRGMVTQDGQTIIVSIPVLNPGETVEIVITTTIASTPSDGVLINVATLTADGGITDQVKATLNIVAGLPNTGYPPSK